MRALLDAPVEQARRAVRAKLLAWLLPLLPVALAVVAMLAFFLALSGNGTLDCLGGGSSAGQPAPSRAAVADIPRKRLRIYQAAGRRFRIDWAFLASIGAQECDHGICAGENGYGCAGPMQISFRRGSPCSPGSGPTLWEIYRFDGDRDGILDIDNPADAVFTAARVLRHAKSAPATGGTYAQYRQAACRYYGACADRIVNYADQVMTRAVRYGFRGAGSPEPTEIPDAAPAPADHDDTIGCASAIPVDRGGKLGPVVRLRGPRRLAPLPQWAIAPGFGAISCDERIVANTVWLVRRYRVRVTACYAIHSLNGEHPLGSALDLVPADGDWSRTERLARGLGWAPSCAAFGTAPACAKPPFRFVAYTGFPGHGDPVGCGCSTPHLHISWNTSASQGQPENQARTTYFAPTWIDVFTTTATESETRDDERKPA